MSQSTCEAELLACNFAAREGLFVKTILEELQTMAELHLYTDSSSALSFASRRGAGRLRHLRVKELWLQEAIREQRLRIFYTPGLTNVSDIFTKSLTRERFEQLANQLGVKAEQELQQPQEQQQQEQ